MINKRVGMVLPGLRAGGVESLFLGLAASLLERGYDVELVLLSLVGDYRRSVPGNINIYGSTLKRIDPEFHNFLQSNRALNYLHLDRFNLLSKRIKYCYQFREVSHSPRQSRLARDAEIVHQYLLKRNPVSLLSGPFKANWATILGSQSLVRKPRTIVTVHGNYALGLDNETVECSRLLYPKADWIVGVSRGATECVKTHLQLPAHKTRHIYNGFHIRDIQKKANASHAAGCQLQSLGAPVVLGIGRLSSDGSKDFDTLIKAFAAVRRSRRAKLVLLCPGNHESRQMRLLQSLCTELQVHDDVAFMEFDDNPYSFMKHASVLVVSSRWEGLPSVLIEAMACGTPVVSTDTPFGPTEILHGGKYGPLVPIGNVDQMAVAIGAVLGGKHLPAELLQARAAEFSIDRMTDRYEELISGTC